MTRKREIERPYPPEFVSAETLGYLLDFSRSTIDDYVSRGLLPGPMTVGIQPRWRWRDVESFILNGNTLAAAPQAGPSSEPDVYSLGAKRVAAAHA